MAKGENNKNEPVPSTVEVLLEQKIAALLEEINVVRLEGRYFCFDKHEARKRLGIYRYRDGNREAIIEVNPRYGHPSILAYRVLQAIFRKVTVEGRPYPDAVAFRYRELGRLVGRDIFGGRDSKEIYEAICQLQDTKVSFILHDEHSRKQLRYRFNLVTSSSFVSEGQGVTPDRIESAVIMLNPAIVDSMRRGHFAIFNWDTITQLDPLTAALYKRVYLHLSNLYEEQYNKDTLKFEKDYAAICAEWLGGLKPERYRSKITQQLGRHFETLKEIGLLRSATIEPMKAGDGFKLVFRPGRNFFRDYAHFYIGSRARLLQFEQAADEAQIKLPVAIVADFYRRLHKVGQIDRTILAKKDVDFAKELLHRLGEDSVRGLVSYAIEEAEKTRFAMKTFRAIESFLPAWQVESEENAARLVVERKAAEAKEEERLQREYENFSRKSVFEYLENASPQEQAEIRARAVREATVDCPTDSFMFGAIARTKERKIVAELMKLPSFADWRSMRE